MFKNKKPRTSVRCPWCFLKDADTTLRYSAKDNLYYCYKCCYTADNYKKASKELNSIKKLKYKSYY